MTLKRANIGLSNKFKIAETQTYQKQIESSMFRRYYSRIKTSIYPALCENPYYGNNIKRLKGYLNNIFRYRIGDHRLFYTIDPDKKLIFILSIHHRKDAYRKL